MLTSVEGGGYIPQTLSVLKEGRKGKGSVEEETGQDEHGEEG